MAVDCVICCEAFDTPRLLNCAHTFCQPCLKKYIEKSNRKGEIVCPLCRAKTLLPNDGVNGLFENYFIPPENNAKLRITECTFCSEVSGVQKCQHCFRDICTNCIPSHNLAIILSEESTFSNEEHCAFGMDYNQTGSGVLYQDQTKTAFRVTLRSSFSVPNENGIGHCAHMTTILPICPNTCVVCPNGRNMFLTYEIDNGLEIDRKYSTVDVVQMTTGINGFPLIIGNNTNQIFECRDHETKEIANTGNYTPFTLAALNNGRFVVFSVTKLAVSITPEIAFSEESHGVLQVMGMYGEIYMESACLVDEVHILKDPRSVCINPTTNDIYVADHGNRNLQMYRENGAYVTSYSPENHRRPRQPFELMNVRYVFPMACCYDAVNSLVLVSDTYGSILALSPNLLLLGHMEAEETFGCPVGINVGYSENIFIGDAESGRLKVYTMSEYSNNLREL